MTLLSVTMQIAVRLTLSLYPNYRPSPGMAIVVHDTTLSGNVDSCEAHFVLISNLQASHDMAIIVSLNICIHSLEYNIQSAII